MTAERAADEAQGNEAGAGPRKIRAVPRSEAAAVADACTLALPRYASEAHKDARAPQNLYPIAGLERELRHRLGDARLLYRSLRQAA